MFNPVGEIFIDNLKTLYYGEAQRTAKKRRLTVEARKSIGGADPLPNTDPLTNPQLSTSIADALPGTSTMFPQQSISKESLCAVDKRKAYQ